MNPLPSSFPKIRIWGDNNYGSGANNALRGFLQALRCLGLGSDHVQVIPISNGSGLYQEMGEHDWLHPYVYRPVIEDQINLAFVHPSFLAGRHTTVGSRYNIAYCPWETDKLPKQFVDELNKYDQVWAPCGLVKQTFKNSGVTAPIHVVQHAVQSELLEAEPSADDSEMVNFYFIGSFNPRKNVEGLIRAWCKTLDAGWGPTTPVRLTLHLVTASRDEAAVQGHSWMAQEMIKQYMASLGPRRQDVARFGVLTAPRKFANIVDLHRRSDIFVTPSRGEGFCLLPDTIVDTVDGPRTIDNVRTGDFVWASSGRITLVEDHTKRWVDEELVSIRRRGCNQPFTGTVGHTHLVVQRHGRRYDSLRKQTPQPEWRSLGELSPGDMMVIPKPVLPPAQDEIDVTQFGPCESSADHAWLTGSFHTDNEVSLTSIAREIGCSFQYVAKIADGKRGGKQTRLYKRIYAALANYVKPLPVKLPRKLLLDEQLMEFFGLFLANGATTERVVEITMHINNVLGSDVIRRTARALNVTLTEGEHKEQHKRTLTLSSTLLSRIIRSLFGRGAANKRIPATLWGNRNIASLIRGYFAGDGSAADGVYRATTTSPFIVEALMQICSANNVLLYLNKGRLGRDLPLYTLTVPQQYNPRFADWVAPYKHYNIPKLPTPRRNEVLEFSTYYLVPIKRISRQRYTGYVHNLHVSEESFTSFGMATHNCLPAAEAAAMGNMVIGTKEAVPFFADMSCALPIADGYGPLPSVVTPIAPMPEVAGYELDQNWWEPQGLAEALVAARADSALFKDHRAYAAVARSYLSPAAVAERVRPLLEEAADVVAKSGW